MTDAGRRGGASLEGRPWALCGRRCDGRHSARLQPCGWHLVGGRSSPHANADVRWPLLRVRRGWAGALFPVWLRRGQRGLRVRWVSGRRV